jgi:hypothetical protein
MMSRRSLTLSQDAYTSLVALKREGESFSDVVLRLTGPDLPLTAYAGPWAGVPKAKIDEIRSYWRACERVSRAKLRRLFSEAVTGVGTR